VNVQGALLRYVLEGSGSPVLVIGSSIYYPRTFSRQAREAFHLAFVDVRHFAEVDPSYPLDKITLDSYTDDIEQVRATVGFERAVLIGHSHHGNLALEYAKRHPARVSHVVLIGSTPCDVKTTIEAGDGYWTEHASEVRKHVLRDNWAALTPEVLGAMPGEEAFVVQYVADGPKYWYDPNYNASALWQDVPVNMELIRVQRDFFAGDYEMSWNPEQMRAPVLVIMGRHDYAVPHTLWEEAQRKLPNITFHLFERSGHTPQLEEPGRFDRTLLEWLQS
jgi:proline iminopeptidase